MSIKERSIALHNRIFETDYYVDLYAVILAENEMSTVNFSTEDYSDAELITMWNDFWAALPEDKAIRREPFFELCNLAEEIYN